METPPKEIALSYSGPSERGLSLVIDQFPAATAVYAGIDHVFVAASELYRKIIGGRDPVGRAIREVLPELASQGFLHLLDQVYTTGQPLGGEDVYAEWDSDGDGVPEPRYIDYTYQPLRDTDGQVWGIVAHITDVTERHRNERDREFLARASDTLASSLDYETTLATVTRLAVEGLADWCAVDELAHDGTLRRIAVAHPDPAKVQLAYQLHKRYPPNLEAPHGVPYVLRTGKPELVPEIPDELLVQAARDEEQLRIARDLGLRSYVCVPLIAREQILGALTFVSAESGRRYGPQDLQLAEQLARRAAVAIDNARLFHETEEARLRAEESAIDLELQTDELQAQAAQLADMQVELEAANDELHLANHELAAHAAWAEQAREAAENANRTSEESRALLDAFFGVAPVAMGFIDPDLRYRRVNQALAALDGTPVDQIVGKTLREVIPDFAPRLEPLYRRVLKSGEAIRDLEVSGPRPWDPSTTAHYIVNYFPVRVGGGEILGVGVVALDITEHRQAEERERILNEVLEESRNEIYMFDAETLRFVQVNYGARQNLGYSIEELQQLTPLDLKPEFSQQRFERLIEPLRRRERDQVQFETVHRRKDGSLYPVDVHLQLSSSGAPPLFVALILDTTERKAAEQELRSAKEEAEEANAAKSQFLTTMSHELRTPLNAIGGYVDLMELGIHGPVTEAQLHSLDRVKKNQQHLIGLITDILNFARIEAGRVEFRSDAIPVMPLLANLDALIEPQVQKKGLAYGYQPCDPALRVRGDEERIQQILLNLVGNAVKFTPSGGWIELSCQDTEAWVRIQVRDNGYGIPTDRMESIFDPFVQVDRKRNEESQQGVGLGLAISRELARGMSGDITVESVPEEGSTFTLVLPRVTAEPGS